MGPPKPRLVLRIGVSGHRPHIFTAPAQAIVRQSLDALFSSFQHAAIELQTREIAFFDGAAPDIRVISALAEGADRIAANAGLAAGFRLDAILPFSPDLYENDFEEKSSRDQYRDLLGRAATRMCLPGVKSPDDPADADRAYEAAGLVMLRQCDVLLTVWDGKASSGRGGTEEIVQHAVATGKPVFWFDEKGAGPFLLITDNSAEPADARDLAAHARFGVVAGQSTVKEIVEHLCAPPAPQAGADKEQVKAATKARQRLQYFLGEKEHRFLPLAFAYPLLLSILSGAKGFWRCFYLPRYVERTRTEWSTYWAILHNAGREICDPIESVVMNRFAWADKLANYYGQLHRSGYVGNFILAASAVLFAAIGESWSQRIELAIITLILGSTAWGMYSDWHRRWVDYRQLSSQLRELRALALTGSSTPEARSPHVSDELQPGSIWVSWYYRMSLREIGLMNTMVDARYVDIARRAIRDGEICDQAVYHRKNAERMESVHWWLEWISRGFFFLTFLICLIEVFGGEHGETVHEILGKISVVLPAFGAALFGITVHGDFEGSAKRSKEMERRLSFIGQKLADQNPISFAELSALAEYGSIVMTGEVGDWGFVYRARPLALPT